MGDQKPRLEVLNKEEPKTKKVHEYADPLESNRGGIAGYLETLLRRGKDLVHLVIIVPLYGLVAIMLGLAAAPGVALFEWLYPLTLGLPYALHLASLGAVVVASYFAYGFSLLLVVPAFNFVFRLNLKPWRGPYYSLEAIRWYLHNGATYMARYTFLEFVTPTPFNVLFYKLMGMKIGRGTAINSSFISDPSMIEMGEKVTIGGSVTLVAHYGQGGYLVLAPVSIGDRVTIGLKATVMGGVKIGDAAKILPHSVVMPKTEIPAGETWGGVPARKIESL